MMYNYHRATRIMMEVEATLMWIAGKGNPRLGGKYAELFAPIGSTPSGNFLKERPGLPKGNYKGPRPQVA